MEDMFQSISPMFSIEHRTWKPLMDIYETPKEIYIHAEIAGVKKEDLEVEINQKAVRIFGKRFSDQLASDATFRLAEIQYGKFERILFLPAPINTEEVTASFKDGFLRIRMIKLPADKTHKVKIT
jgi:HSP20 family protein